MNVIRFLSGQTWVERLGWTLLNFVWQGILLAGLYAIARRRSACATAQVRYVLTCATLAAMLALPLITFALSTSENPGPVTSLVARAPLASVLQPIPFHSLPLNGSPARHDNVMPWLVIAWFTGSMVLWMRLIGGWLVATRMRAALAREVSIEWEAAEFGARSCTGGRWLVEAGHIAACRRAHGPATRASKALLTHELAHIRRRDYLVNILQSVAEALLFFHPAVWWVSNHIRTERELCCDDIAAAIGGDTLTYVQALAGLESHRPEHLIPPLAANGGLLSYRIARLLGRSRAPVPTQRGAGMAVCGLLLAATACGLLGQATDARPAFEVASIKPDKSETGVDRIQISKGSLVIVNVSLKRLIGMAWGPGEGRDYLFSGPDWLDSERFDISAKYPPETANPEVLLMLQRLLEERLVLKLHREAREFSVYALVVAKGGPKLHPAAAAQAPYTFRAQAGHAAGTSLSMPQLADRLSRPAFQLGRQVVDFTGLTGTFENQNDDLARPSIFSALPEQLGLRLEARKVPLDVLVVDYANKMPTQN